MVRTRKESSNETSPKKPLSLTQWSRKHWLDPWKCVAGNIKHRNVHQLKAKNNPASQLKQSNQKKVGTRIKDRYQKWRAVEDSQVIAVPSPTEQVQKHPQDKIKFDFHSKKQKVEHVAKALNLTLSVLSPQGKVHAVFLTCSKSLSPTSRCNVASNIHGIR